MTEENREPAPEKRWQDEGADGDFAQWRVLDPASVTFWRRPGGVLSALVDGAEHVQVNLLRAFPLTRPTEFIALRDGEGKEIGVLSRLSDLDEASRDEAQRDLRLRYHVPVVTKIVRIVRDPSSWRWEVETDRGPLRLVLPNLHEHLRPAGDGRHMLTDVGGRRCELPAESQLDPHSRRQLRKVF